MIMCKKAAARFIHKIISDKAPKQLFDKLKFNNRHRKCSKISLKIGFKKEVNKQTLMNASVTIFHNLKPSLKYLSKANFRREMKKLTSLD